MKNFKFKLIIIFMGMGSTSLFAQVKKLNDPSIVAHHKRMVFESWGDFRPYPKYVLGLQTNFAYATVWGWLAPSRNRTYRDGNDIRPLKPTGLEVQRFAELEMQRKETEKIKITVDSLNQRNIQDFIHWTSATVEADPLWLLYYKKMLQPLKIFPDYPQNHLEWKIKDEATYQNMISTGGIFNLQKELDLLKDQYKNALTLDMPRGKRFLMYHDTLLKWRKFSEQSRGLSYKNSLYLDYKKMLTLSQSNIETLHISRDVIIVQNVMNQYNSKF